MKTLIKCCWIATAAGAVFGGIDFAFTWALANNGKDVSAPQYAASAAGALAMAVIPYCLARAVEGMADPENRK